MNTEKLIKNLFRSEIIEVAGHIAWGVLNLDNDPDSGDLCAYYEDYAQELGAEYGFDEKDWEEVRHLCEITDLSENYENFDFFRSGETVARLAGLPIEWEY